MRLLLRDRRTVRLTAAGETFRREALEILRRNEEAVRLTKRASLGKIPRTPEIQNPSLLDLGRNRWASVFGVFRRWRDRLIEEGNESNEEINKKSSSSSYRVGVSGERDRLCRQYQGAGSSF